MKDKYKLIELLKEEMNDSSVPKTFRVIFGQYIVWVLKKQTKLCTDIDVGK